jgi:N-acetylglucosaminyl-diphospho-decaprenol L-rhamnosyltransferase
VERETAHRTAGAPKGRPPGPRMLASAGMVASTSARAESTPELSVITVTHNHGPFIGALLDSLDEERKRIDLEVLVVDNASDDDGAAVAASRPWVRVIRKQTRHGFAFNNNLAIRTARGRHVLLLNPDTEVRPGALPQLVAYLDAHPRVGICGPRLLFPDGSVQPSARRFPTLGWVVARRTPLRLVLGRTVWSRRHLMEDGNLDAPQEVDWLLGAALAVRRDLLRTVGLLDEGYFLYVEDIDWAYRARRAGWEVHYVPAAEVVHHYQAEIDRALLTRRSWIHARAMWRFYRKHMAPRWLRMRVEPERLA